MTITEQKIEAFYTNLDSIEYPPRKGRPEEFGLTEREAARIGAKHVQRFGWLGIGRVTVEDFTRR